MAMTARSRWRSSARSAPAPRTPPGCRSISRSRDDSDPFSIRRAPVPGGAISGRFDDLAQASGCRDGGAVSADERATPCAHDLPERRLAKEVDQTLGESHGVLFQVE